MQMLDFSSGLLSCFHYNVSILSMVFYIWEVGQTFIMSSPPNRLA